MVLLPEWAHEFMNYAYTSLYFAKVCEIIQFYDFLKLLDLNFAQKLHDFEKRKKIWQVSTFQPFAHKSTALPLL